MTAKVNSIISDTPKKYPSYKELMSEKDQKVMVDIEFYSRFDDTDEMLEMVVIECPYYICSAEWKKEDIGSKDIILDVVWSFPNEVLSDDIGMEDKVLAFKIASASLGKALKQVDESWASMIFHWYENQTLESLEKYFQSAKSESDSYFCKSITPYNSTPKTWH